MLVANPFSKKLGSLRRKQPRRDHAEDPNHNVDVETLRKLRMYQRRTYMNQEQSRRRSLQRHNKHQSAQNVEGGMAIRPPSAPNTETGRHYDQQLQEKNDKGYRQRSSSELQVPSRNHDITNSRRNNSKEKIIGFTSRPRVCSEASRLKHIDEFQEQTALRSDRARNTADTVPSENNSYSTSLCQITIEYSPDLNTRAVEDSDQTVLAYGEAKIKSGETHIRSGENPARLGETEIKSGGSANTDCIASSSKFDIKGDTVSNPEEEEETSIKTLIGNELSNRDSISSENNITVTTTTKNKHKDISRKGSTKSLKRSKYLLSCISSDKQ